MLVWCLDDGSLLQALETLEVGLIAAGTPEELLHHLPYADGVIMSAAQLTDALKGALRKSAPGLRWLHLLNAGFDTVKAGDFGREVKVTYSPGAGATTVAEHGLALMLALARGLPQALAEQRRGRWDYGLGRGLTSLRGRTALIFGFGHVGTALAQLLSPFGMRVIAVSRHGGDKAGVEASCPMEDAERHLPECDHIVVAAPLTDETRGYFDAARLGRFKPGAFLTNLSRGAIVDLEALGSALEAGRLAGAALDVTDPEPLPQDHPIWSAPNLLVTPHIAAAGANRHDRAELIRIALENCRRFAEGEPLLHVVDLSQGIVVRGEA